jgi:hypothetical protein
MDSQSRLQVAVCLRSRSLNPASRRRERKRHCHIGPSSDADAEPVTVETDDGTHPMFAEGDFEVGHPPGVKPGTPVAIPLAFGFPTPPPPAGRSLRLAAHHRWRDGRRLAADVLDAAERAAVLAA